MSKRARRVAFFSILTVLAGCAGPAAPGDPVGLDRPALLKTLQPGSREADKFI
jgi:hypothetical protein